MLFLVATPIVFLFPSAVNTLFNSGGFFLGQWAVIGMLFIYALTRNGRKDLDEDFWKSVGSNTKLQDRLRLVMRLATSDNSLMP